MTMPETQADQFGIDNGKARPLGVSIKPYNTHREFALTQTLRNQLASVAAAMRFVGSNCETQPNPMLRIATDIDELLELLDQHGKLTIHN